MSTVKTETIDDVAKIIAKRFKIFPGQWVNVDDSVPKDMEVSAETIEEIVDDMDVRAEVKEIENMAEALALFLSSLAVVSLYKYGLVAVIITIAIIIAGLYDAKIEEKLPGVIKEKLEKKLKNCEHKK